MGFTINRLTRRVSIMSAFRPSASSGRMPSLCRGIADWYTPSHTPAFGRQALAAFFQALKAWPEPPAYSFVFAFFKIPNLHIWTAHLGWGVERQKPRAGTDFCSGLHAGKKSERLLPSEDRPRRGRSSVPAKHPTRDGIKKCKFVMALFYLANLVPLAYIIIYESTTADE